MLLRVNTKWPNLSSWQTLLFPWMLFVPDAFIIDVTMCNWPPLPLCITHPLVFLVLVNYPPYISLVFYLNPSTWPTRFPHLSSLALPILAMSSPLPLSLIYLYQNDLASALLSRWQETRGGDGFLVLCRMLPGNSKCSTGGFWHLKVVQLVMRGMCTRICCSNSEGGLGLFRYRDLTHVSHVWGFSKVCEVF